MQKKIYLLSIFCLLIISNFCFANETNVSVDMKCDDQTIKYTILQAALEIITKSEKHTIDQTKPHVLKIIFAVSTIKDENNTIQGAAVAILAITKKAGTDPKIIHFGNEVTDMKNLEKSVQKRVRKIIQ